MTSTNIYFSCTSSYTVVVVGVQLTVAGVFRYSETQTCWTGRATSPDTTYQQQQQDWIHYTWTDNLCTPKVWGYSAILWARHGHSRIFSQAVTRSPVVLK